jgi:hypothetical protein
MWKGVRCSERQRDKAEDVEASRTLGEAGEEEDTYGGVRVCAGREQQPVCVRKKRYVLEIIAFPPGLGYESRHRCRPIISESVFPHYTNRLITPAIGKENSQAPLQTEGPGKELPS